MWLLMALFSIVAMSTSRSERTVLHAYRLGSTRWMAGEPLYDDTGHGFLYFPQSAVLFIPWAALPYWWGETLWRLFLVATLALGTAAFLRAAQPTSWPKMFPGVSLAAMAIGWSAVRTGQMTVVMTGLMLICLADLMEGRWSRAAAWAWLALALKPIILPFLLLVAALWPRQMAGRMAAGLVVTALMPFLFQRPDYVIAQYRLLPVMLQSAHDLGHRLPFAQAFGMLSVLGYSAPETWQTAWRAAAALGVLSFAAAAKRRFAARDFGPLLGALAASYILLFNPRTEGNTYALIGPFVGYYAACRFQNGRRTEGTFLTLAACLLVGHYEIGRLLFRSRDGIYVLAPAVTIVFVVWLAFDTWRQRAMGVAIANGKASLLVFPQRHPAAELASCGGLGPKN